MEKNWTIADLRRYPENGLVFNVTYIINFTLEDIEDRLVGRLQLEGNSEDENFIPFEELTEEVVIGWVKETLGEEEIEEIYSNMETILEEKLERKNNPPFLGGRPWDKNLEE